MSTLLQPGFSEVLVRQLGQLVELSAAQVSALAAHYELLMKWNRVLNLTTIRNLAEVVERHYCESVFGALQLPKGPLSVVDVGSGAGFPGVPLAVVRPDCKVCLVESHQRKGVFLREATRSMGNVRVLAVRAEGITERFDWVVSRAVSFDGLAGVLGKLGRHAAILSGGEAPPAGIKLTWDEAIRMPWGDQRFVRIGHGLGE
jgi:16S rRNA (guanine527-N7)-methyltransferase